MNARSDMENVGNPFSDVKNILTATELIDIAFNKAMKIKPPSGRHDALSKTRILEINRINTAANVLVNNIENMVSNFPSLNLIHPFYLELTSILLDVDDLRRNLGRINGVTEHIRNLEDELKDKILSEDSKVQVKNIRKIAFARYASMIKRIKTSLQYVKKAQNKLKPLPGFNPYSPSIVVCGFPNTGKSSFIRHTTSGKPEVANYPFTTKKIIFGHRKFGFMNVQFIDTPGLLDRPIIERNVIELQAIAVFKHLADILIYLIDPTINATATIMEQLNLYKEIQKFYPMTLLLPVISKCDLLTKEELITVNNTIINCDIIKPETKIWTVHTNDESGVTEIISYLEEKVLTDFINSPKFKQISSFEIADDQLTYDELDEEEFF
ncbi:MAG: GTPase Obg/CgtA [Candidatus Heimdallarchaeota archaeon LC_2]|nr:MAG: GTPase Obg/CgtA [Candidatus Heimdallarchaeota archaeon LC_2]